MPDGNKKHLRAYRHSDTLSYSNASGSFVFQLMQAWQLRERARTYGECPKRDGVPLLRSALLLGLLVSAFRPWGLGRRDAGQDS